jgi:hypothetical protein
MKEYTSLGAYLGGKQSKGIKVENKQKEKKKTKRSIVSIMSNKPYPDNKAS